MVDKNTHPRDVLLRAKAGEGVPDPEISLNRPSGRYRLDGEPRQFVRRGLRILLSYVNVACVIAHGLARQRRPVAPDLDLGGCFKAHGRHGILLGAKHRGQAAHTGQEKRWSFHGFTPKVTSFIQRYINKTAQSSGFPGTKVPKRQFVIDLAVPVVAAADRKARTGRGGGATFSDLGAAGEAA